MITKISNAWHTSPNFAVIHEFSLAHANREQVNLEALSDFLARQRSCHRLCPTYAISRALPAGGPTEGDGSMLNELLCMNGASPTAKPAPMTPTHQPGGPRGPNPGGGVSRIRPQDGTSGASLGVPPSSLYTEIRGGKVLYKNCIADRGRCDARGGDGRGIPSLGLP